MGQPSFVSNVSGATNPERGGGIYIGKINKVRRGQASVSVPMLGLVSQPCDTLNAFGNDPYEVGERVVVAFLEHQKETLVVLGRVNRSSAAFPTLEQFTALVDRVSALEATVASLQSQLNTHSH